MKNTSDATPLKHKKKNYITIAIWLNYVTEPTKTRFCYIITDNKQSNKQKSIKHRNKLKAGQQEQVGWAVHLVVILVLHYIA